MKYLMADNLTDIENAISQIDQNCGWPDSYTETWAIPQQAYEQDIWFFPNVPANGYIGGGKILTYEQMMNNVVNVTASDGDSSWFPPAPP